MKVAKVKELIDSGDVCQIQTTSVQRIAANQVSNLTVDEENEVVEYDDHGLHFTVDCADINFIITNPDKIEFSWLSIP